MTYSTKKKKKKKKLELGRESSYESCKYLDFNKLMNIYNL
jgi:hypothetical protein